MEGENKALLFSFSPKKKKKSKKYNEKTNYIFVIREDWKICDQILQVVTILWKNILFIKVFSILIFCSAMVF